MKDELKTELFSMNSINSSMERSVKYLQRHTLCTQTNTHKSFSSPVCLEGFQSFVIACIKVLEFLWREQATLGGLQPPAENKSANSRNNQGFQKANGF